MIARDEDALACDFAETYRILDFRALPARKAAQLACGLRPDARIILRMAGLTVSVETLLLAMIADATRTTMWLNTTDAVDGKNQPKSIAAILAGRGEQEGAGFDTAEEFEAWRASMIGGDTNA